MAKKTTKKKAAKPKTAKKKTAKTKKKKVKVKKGSKYVCGVCGRITTVDTFEDIDAVYGYVTEEDIICCGEVMGAK